MMISVSKYQNIVVQLTVAQAEIARLQAERDAIGAAMVEACAARIEEGFDRGIHHKADTCVHGKYGWEDCEGCCVAAIRTLANPSSKATLDKLIADAVQSDRAAANQNYADQVSSAPAPVADAELEALETGDKATLLIEAKWEVCLHGGGWWVVEDADGNDVLLSSTALRARKAQPVGVMVKPLVLSEARKLWLQHGGRVAGPRVETWGMPEANVMGFLAALTTAQDTAMVKPLVDALSFYADASAWTQPPVRTKEGLVSIEYENQASRMQRDRGRIAREALAAAQSVSEGGE